MARREGGRTVGRTGPARSAQGAQPELNPSQPRTDGRSSSLLAEQRYERSVIVSRVAPDRPRSLHTASAVDSRPRSRDGNGKHDANSRNPQTGSQPKLRRTLATWAAISLSVAAMGASLAININPQGAGATVGRAVPLTFILATVGVLLVAYGFARVCSRLSHAGSVFGLTGVTIGPRAGVVAGWSLLGAYLSFMLTTVHDRGHLRRRLPARPRALRHDPDIVPWLIALVAVAIATLLAISPVKKSMATLLWVEISPRRSSSVIGSRRRSTGRLGHAPGGTAASRWTCSPCRPACRPAPCSSASCSASCPSPDSRPRPRSVRRPPNPKRAIPIAHLRRRAIRRHVLHHRHRAWRCWASAPTRGGRRLLQVGIALRHARRAVRRPGGRRPRHARHGDLGDGLRAGHRGGRVSAAVRDEPRRAFERPAASPRSPPRRARPISATALRLRTGRSHHRADASRGHRRRRSTCSPGPAPSAPWCCWWPTRCSPQAPGTTSAFGRPAAATKAAPLDYVVPVLGRRR